MRTLFSQNQQQQGGGQGNLILMVLMFMILMWWMRPPEQADNRKVPDQDVRVEKREQVLDDTEEDGGRTVDETKAEPLAVTLGSLDPNDPYRMLVTLTNVGAAVNRIELAEERYRDVQDRSGYMGQIVADLATISPVAPPGCPVQVVGKGTPAEKAGLKPGDLITYFQPAASTGDGPGVMRKINSYQDLREALFESKPGRTVRLHVERDGKPHELDLQLSHAPISIVRPEATPSTYESYIGLGGLRAYESGKCDQLSFLATLNQVDDVRLDAPASFGNKNGKVDVPRDETLDEELMRVELRKGCWELVSADRDEAVFRKTVPRFKLEMIKRYRLENLDGKKGEAAGGRLGLDASGQSAGYHLTLSVEVRNLDTKARKVAYQLDGPSGAPLEGAWYSRKTGPEFGNYGIRDLVVHFPGDRPAVISNNLICYDAVDEAWKNQTPYYIGVDATYFQCTVLPNRMEGDDEWVSRIYPLRIGKKVAKWTQLTNNSFRIVSTPLVLDAADENGAGGGQVRHEYTIFAGPKNPKVLVAYGLDRTLSYGWFAVIVKPLLALLHFFHGFGLGYGVAIILLTIVVRLIMYPLSRKQAYNAAKMQELAPELTALKEKYQDDPQAMLRAQQALWKKHKCHPASGCLGLFIQIPIFVALYKALSVDVELYGVSLITPALRWCNDLSGPDMLFYWGGFWNWLGLTSFNTGQGMLYLGPYFNLLPMLTVTLFLIQQWVMMPPPTDDQSRMQRTMMNVMMPMMGLLFFKMPSGLCVYFIVSTLWGLAERKLVPKSKLKTNLDGETIDTTFADSKTERSETPERSRTAKSPASKPSKPSRSERAAKDVPPKEEGVFRKFIREINEKASEQRKLGKAEEKKPRRKKKKK